MPEQESASIRELIESYYDYQHWANQRMLATARGVPFELLTSVQIEGFPPVRDTFVHILMAQKLWLERWQGQKPAPQLRAQDFPDFTSIEARWEIVDGQTTEFRRSLTDERLSQPIAYEGLRGGHSTYPLWQAMLHQANHATYHRGEIAAVLTHLGTSPGEMDFFRMFDRG